MVQGSVGIRGLDEVENVLPVSKEPVYLVLIIREHTGGILYKAEGYIHIFNAIRRLSAQVVD